MGKKRFLGKNARLHYNSGDYETPSWTPINTRTTLAVALGSTVVDVTAEDSDGEMWEQVVLKSRGLEFEAFPTEDDGDNTALNAIQAAYESGTPMEFAVARGDITEAGTRYRRLPGFEIQECGEDFALDGAAKIKVVAKPAPCENKPSNEVTE